MSEDAMIGQHGYSTEAHHLQIRLVPDFQFLHTVASLVELFGCRTNCTLGTNTSIFFRSSDKTKLPVIAGEAIRRDRLFDHGQDIP
jgi:hypothetical protein